MRVNARGKSITTITSPRGGRVEALPQALQRPLHFATGHQASRDGSPIDCPGCVSRPLPVVSTSVIVMIMIMVMIMIINTIITAISTFEAEHRTWIPL